MHVGWHWASQTHDITVIDGERDIVDWWALRHDAAGLDAAIARLATHGQPEDLPVAMETTSGLVVDRLLAAGHPAEGRPSRHDLYPLDRQPNQVPPLLEVRLRQAPCCYGLPTEQERSNGSEHGANRGTATDRIRSPSQDDVCEAAKDRFTNREETIMKSPDYDSSYRVDHSKRSPMIRLLRTGVLLATLLVPIATSPSYAQAPSPPVTALNVDTGSGPATVAAIPEVSTSATITCSPLRFVDIRGGHASYRTCLSGPYIQVSGQVQDTRADGKCAQVKAYYRNNPAVDYSGRACPKGDSVSFRFPWRTSNTAYVYLFLS